MTKKKKRKYTKRSNKWNKLIKAAEVLNKEAPQKAKEDVINKPNHYQSPFLTRGGQRLEVIDVAEAWGLEKDSYLFNMLTYVLRCGKKDANPEAQDLKKAKYYLNRRIENIELGR